MHARIWFIGFTLGIAVVGHAAASAAAQGLGDTGRASSHGGLAHSSGSDTLALSGDSSSRSSSDSSDSNSNAGSGDDRSGDTLPEPAPPAAPQHAHLGWQSLLPGSIQ
jgi:hypothetical protein